MPLGDRPKERIKLRASAVDRISTVVITLGFLAPVVSWISTGTPPFHPAILFGALVAAGLFHYIGNLILGGLDP